MDMGKKSSGDINDSIMQCAASFMQPALQVQEKGLTRMWSQSLEPPKGNPTPTGRPVA
jgi:hypothetical protein